MQINPKTEQHKHKNDETKLTFKLGKKLDEALARHKEALDNKEKK